METSFCEKFQKIGHKCGDKARIKKWIPKLKTHEDVSITTTPLKQPEVVEEEGEGWTQVGKTGRGQGTKCNTSTTDKINCNNGFETLEVLNDQLVTIVIAPC